MKLRASGPRSRAGNQADLVRFLPEAVHHGRSHVMHGLRSGKAIGVRKKITFEGVRVRVNVLDQRGFAARHANEILAMAELGVFDGGRDVEEVVAFRNSNLVKVNVTASNSVVDPESVRPVIKKVFAGL